MSIPQEILVRIRSDADADYAASVLARTLEQRGWFSADFGDHVEVRPKARSHVEGERRVQQALNDEITAREGLDRAKHPTEWERLFRVESAMP